MDQYRIKVVKGVFAGYTGVLGMGHQFIDGVSVEPLTTAEAQMIAAEGDTYIVDENGEFVVDSAGAPYKVMPGAMPVPDSLGVSFADSKREVKVEKVEETPSEPASMADEAEPAEPAEFTREALEAIADKEGLRGLREIGDSVGAKGKSIPELIERILEKAGK